MTDSGETFEHEGAEYQFFNGTKPRPFIETVEIGGNVKVFMWGREIPRLENALKFVEINGEQMFVEREGSSWPIQAKILSYLLNW